MTGTPARVTLALVVVAAPLLVAPSRLPSALWPLAAALAVLVIAVTTWHLRRVAGHGLVVLSLAVVVAALRAPVEGALPHLGGYALGLGLACGVLRGGPAVALRAYAVAGAGAVVVGLLFLRVDTFKFLPLAVTDALPQLGRHLPWLGGEGRVNPNALSALCLMGAPITWAAVQERERLWRVFAWGGLSLAGLALVLAQSRAAWLAIVVVAAGVCVHRAWREPTARRSLIGAGVVGVASGALWWWWDPVEVDRIVASAWSTFDRRGHTWEAAWSMARDHLWTGVGLDQFRVRYVPAATALPGFDIAHAHNFPMQLLLDVGLIGFAGYAWVLWSTCGQAWRHWEVAAAHGRPREGRPEGAALVALAALHVYGLFDAVALGTKVGLFQWWIMSIVWARDGAPRTRVFRWTQQTPPKASPM